MTAKKCVLLDWRSIATVSLHFHQNHPKNLPFLRLKHTNTVKTHPATCAITRQLLACCQFTWLMKQGAVKLHRHTHTHARSKRHTPVNKFHGRADAYLKPGSNPCLFSEVYLCRAFFDQAATSRCSWVHEEVSRVEWSWNTLLHIQENEPRCAANTSRSDGLESSRIFKKADRGVSVWTP